MDDVGNDEQLTTTTIAQQWISGKGIIMIRDSTRFRFSVVPYFTSKVS